MLVLNNYGRLYSSIVGHRSMHRGVDPTIGMIPLPPFDNRSDHIELHHQQRLQVRLEELALSSRVWDYKAQGQSSVCTMSRRALVSACGLVAGTKRDDLRKLFRVIFLYCRRHAVNRFAHPHSVCLLLADT